MQNVPLDKLKRGDELLFTTGKHDYILMVCWPRERIGILRTTGDRRFKLSDNVVQYDDTVIQNLGTVFLCLGQAVPKSIPTPPILHLEIFGENYSYEIF